MMDLSLSIGALRLANPLIAASGCFGYGVEYAEVVDLSALVEVGMTAMAIMLPCESRGEFRDQCDRFAAEVLSKLP